jgi:hypothetical protein
MDHYSYGHNDTKQLAKKNQRPNYTGKMRVLGALVHEPISERQRGGCRSGMVKV